MNVRVTVIDKKGCRREGVYESRRWERENEKAINGVHKVVDKKERESDNKKEVTDKHSEPSTSADRNAALKCNNREANG